MKIFIGAYRSRGGDIWYMRPQPTMEDAEMACTTVNENEEFIGIREFDYDIS